MVQPSGQIFGLSPEASIAVQCHLFKLGYSHISASGVLPGMSAIYWYTSKRIWPVPPMSNDLTTHKLADFNLDPEGNELVEPTRTYEFGEKVKTSIYDTDPRYFAGSTGNIAYFAKTPLNGNCHAMITTTSLSNITPWPTPVTFPLTLTIDAIAEKGKVAFNGITLTIEQLQNAIDQAKATL